MASPEQLAKPIIAERHVGDLHIVLRDSAVYDSPDECDKGINIAFIAPDKTVEIDLTALEADWLKTLLMDVI